MSSQFKRKKTGTLKERNKDSSLISASRRLGSNLTNEFQTELKDIEAENDNILGSLVDEKQDERRVNDIVKRVEMSQKLTTERASRIEAKTETRGQEEKKDEGEGDDVNPHIGNDDKSVRETREKEVRVIKPIILMPPESEDDLEEPKEPEKPKMKAYGEDPDLILMVMALKKYIKMTDEENSVVRKKNLDFTVREFEYQARLKELAMKAEELELEKKLMHEKPSDNIKFDIDDLDSRLRVMDDNLQKATGESSQERFLEDIVARNKVFTNKTQANSAAMKKLKDNLAGLRSTLLAITSK